MIKALQTNNKKRNRIQIKHYDKKDNQREST